MQFTRSLRGQKTREWRKSSRTPLNKRVLISVGFLTWENKGYREKKDFHKFYSFILTDSEMFYLVCKRTTDKPLKAFRCNCRKGWLKKSTKVVWTKEANHTFQLLLVKAFINMFDLHYCISKVSLYWFITSHLCKIYWYLWLEQEKRWKSSKGSPVTISSNM